MERPPRRVVTVLVRIRLCRRNICAFGDLSPIQLEDKPIHLGSKLVLGGGLEPPCLSAYAPQTYVSAIPPPERREGANFPQTATAGKCRFRLCVLLLIFVIEGSR